MLILKIWLAYDQILFLKLFDGSKKKT
jgi:hypothetical protein